MSMRFVGSDDFGVHFCTVEYRHFLDVAPAIANDLAGGEIRQSEMTPWFGRMRMRVRGGDAQPRGLGGVDIAGDGEIGREIYGVDVGRGSAGPG
jgi:hypothetical protein